MYRVDVLTEEGYKPNIEKQCLSDGAIVYFASHPELLGVDGSGETEDEARESFEENLEFYIRHLKESDLPLPTPTFVHAKVTISDARPLSIGPQHSEHEKTESRTMVAL